MLNSYHLDFFPEMKKEKKKEKTSFKVMAAVKSDTGF